MRINRGWKIAGGIVIGILVAVLWWNIGQNIYQVDQSITADPSDCQEDLRFAVIGDFGDAGQYEADVAAMVHSWDVELIVTTGDNNYPDGKASTIDPNIGQYYSDFIYPYKGNMVLGQLKTASSQPWEIMTGGINRSSRFMIISHYPAMSVIMISNVGRCISSCLIATTTNQMGSHKILSRPAWFEGASLKYSSLEISFYASSTLTAHLRNMVLLIRCSGLSLNGVRMPSLPDMPIFTSGCITMAFRSLLMDWVAVGGRFQKSIALVMQ